MFQFLFARKLNNREEAKLEEEELSLSLSAGFLPYIY